MTTRENVEMLCPHCNKQFVTSKTEEVKLTLDMDKARKIIIIFLIFGGWIFSMIFNDIKGIGCMCLGIWFMQLLHQTND